MKYASLIIPMLAAMLSGCEMYKSLTSEEIIGRGKVTAMTHFSIDMDLLKNRPDATNAAYARNVDYFMDNIHDNLVFDLINIQTLDSLHTDIKCLILYDYKSEYYPRLQDKMFHSEVTIGDTVNVYDSKEIIQENACLPVSKNMYILARYYAIPYDKIRNAGHK